MILSSSPKTKTGNRPTDSLSPLDRVVLLWPLIFLLIVALLSTWAISEKVSNG